MRENLIVVKNGGKGPLFGRNQLRQQSQMFRLILSITLERTVSVSALKSHFFLLKNFGHSSGKMKKNHVKFVWRVDLSAIALQMVRVCVSIACPKNSFDLLFKFGFSFGTHEYFVVLCLKRRR